MQMESPNASPRSNNGVVNTPESTRDSTPRNVPLCSSDAQTTSSVPKVSLGPMRSDQRRKIPGTHGTNTPKPPDNVDNLRKEMDTQEKIIVALQHDNEALLREKKDIAARYKELESKYEHLEAKHSLLLSAQQDLDSRSNLRVANEAAKAARLQTEVQELETALEAEKRKCFALVLSRDAPEEPRTGFTPGSEKDAPVCVPSAHKAGLAENGDQASRLREYERVHDVQNATIDTLHKEVDRLETEKKKWEARQRDSARQVEDLEKRTRELESAVAQKKESIAELLRTCQDGAVNSQRAKKQESRIQSLEAALAEKDEFTRTAMGRLRDETREVRTRYQEIIADLERRLERSSDHAELRNRLKALEDENIELRRALAGNGTRTTVTTDADPGATEKEPDRTRASQAEARQGGGRQGEAAEAPARFLRLETQVKEAAAETAKYKKISADLQEELANTRSEWDAQLRGVKKSFISQLQLMRSRHNEEVDRLEANHRSELLALSKQNRDDIDGFSAKLISIVERKGYDSSLLAICERLNYLEKHSLQKEEEMKYELAEVKRIAEMEKRVIKEKADLQIEQKNMQIKSFRLQLDELLAAIAVLQAMK